MQNSRTSEVVSFLPAVSEVGHVFWLFGLSGAGKSTLAEALRRDLLSRNARGVLMLDGDRLRSGLNQGLGFSDADRDENLRRAAEVARLGVENGLTVIAAFITPREEQRRRLEEIVGADRISLIYIDSPLAVCRQRDVKGLYARADLGEIKKMTGLGSRFELPASAALVLETNHETPHESATRLAAFARLQLPSVRAVG
jgi:adenylylsulfate kinase